ncbi:beta/gamma crystallin-related protein [Nitrospirillum iridis]|uniref:Beta/gamma crystallin 'Greek key' domain-containing protein n=1 Tax=Nitrospirillum iridis TaxID=765888 RepID=A0A7X0B148_9PROT|nr:beta/gamma crystallin-related protein [Nitrospirillum iridis]MBB6253863.1 hypothetical protein [Nitrospirillum iridis]
MGKRWPVLVCVLLAMPVPAPALAGDGHVVLYSDRDRKGGAFDITEDTENLGFTTWNDRARSLVVMSGRWEVCRHAGYRDCVTLSAWEDVDDLSRIGLDQAISSLRQIDRPQAPRQTSSVGIPIVWNDDKPRSMWSMTSAIDCRPDIRAAFVERFGSAGEGDLAGDEVEGTLTWGGKPWGYHCAYRQIDIWPER